MKHICFLLTLIILLNLPVFSQITIIDHSLANNTPISTKAQLTYIYTDSSDDWLIQKSAQFLQQDIELVTSKKPIIIHDLSIAKNNLIIIGSIQKSITIRNLVASKKINIEPLINKWEAFQISTIQNLTKDIHSALIITGSDKRGTAYAVFEVSKQIGVSPWYWWADVPSKKKKEIFISNGVYNYNSPSVKYRGIFINDEAPAFAGWTREKFGGFNHLVYEKMFELLLRLKANYLWPAMWGNAFNDDDKANPILADQYGIVMGTSHHEPMLRAQQEWKKYGSGSWNYNNNDSVLRSFWKKGIQNMGTHESIVTIGMRGDGDEPMTQGTAISLLEKIVADQRKIIEEITHQPAEKQPQLWALYKEVQDYYDKGMRVPDDITLLLCDDNWGNIRKLPKLGDPKRAGGYGIYYHFDYVGDPRNYKWLNTNNISRVWEQMHLAYEYGVDKIWIVNVGDLKPMEFPISFFLDYAWDTKKWNEDNIMNYYTLWAKEQFGNTYAKEIGHIIERYSQLSARKKPELINSTTYSLQNYNEALNLTNDFQKLLVDAENVNLKIGAEYKDAYFELVLHPVKALNTLIQLYTTVEKNKLAAKNFQSNTNQLADLAKQLYKKDSLISVEYHQIAKGKWNHMMDQTHIGYTYWQQPEINKMPEVTYLNTEVIRPAIAKIKENSISAKSIIPKNSKGHVFFEQNGYISINAENYSNAITNSIIKWKTIPNIGRNSSGVTTFPVTAPSSIISSRSPHLQYVVYTYDTGLIKINSYFSPTLNFQNTDGLKCAISVDEEAPQIININDGLTNASTWGNWVANNVITKTTTHHIKTAGKHVIKFWMVDSGIVLQKIITDLGGLKESYLGPSETSIKINLK
jgi:hypothetical protein